MNDYPRYPHTDPGGYNPQNAPGTYGYYPPGPQFGPPPENNLVWGILTTILCCMPLGIVSIVKATQVDSLWAQGQFDAASKAADEARKFAIWSAAAYGTIAVIAVVFYAVAFVVSMSSS